MIVSFAISSSPRPIGGVTAQYAFANALARRGHEVHIVHAEFFGCRIDSLDDLAWFEFEPSIQHHIPGMDLWFPPADLIFGTGAPVEAGLPVLLLQGLDIMQPKFEEDGLRSPGLKVCIARWLVDSGVRLGVPAERFRVVNMGIDHERYRVLDPVVGRPPRVAMLHHAHPAKGTPVGLEVLEAARRRVPTMTAELFGTAEPVVPLPSWVTFRLDPTPEDLVGEVYNGSQVFLQASDHEGFGFTAVEAMACGCALVTTDNGGSREYADHDETALVAAPRDVGGLADHVVALLEDDRRLARLAESGRQRVLRFDWDLAGEAMERVLEEYLAEPAPYLAPLPDPHVDDDRFALLGPGDHA